MKYLRSRLSRLSFTSRNEGLAVAAFLLLTLSSFAQDQAKTGEQPNMQPGQQEAGTSTVTIPAGTRFALVLTHPIQSRYVHRGDDIYAQITSPVDSGNEVVIPAGTFVHGTVDNLARKGGRADLHLQSMAITFPDGYVLSIAGPITLESSDGYAWKDPGGGRVAGAFALPAGGAGLGALIGHSVGASSSTITSSVPPGCTGAPPYCVSSSLTVPGNSGRKTAIGAGIGVAIGGLASMAILFSSHNFFIDVGAPVEMTLQKAVTVQETEVTKAVQDSEQHPVAEQPVAPRPVPPPPPDTPVDHGTCYTPGTPGTPPTVIPGAPGPDGIPGPPTIIPGTPPTPGTPYPCP